MDIFITLLTFAVITLRAMKAFLLIFLVNLRGGMEVLLADSFHRISGEHPGGLHEILVFRESPHGEIGWRSLCFVLCLFICLLFVSLLFVLCVSFLIIFKGLVVGSCISHAV